MQQFDDPYNLRQLLSRALASGHVLCPKLTETVATFLVTGGVVFSSAASMCEWNAVETAVDDILWCCAIDGPGGGASKCILKHAVTMLHSFLPDPDAKD